MSEIDRYCIMATGDKHPSLLSNLKNVPVEVYLRDTEEATTVRGYIDLVQSIEAMCFKAPSPNWVIAHFALNGPGMIVTAEHNREPIAAQYVAADNWEGRMGLRLWTTVVHPEMRRLQIASTLTAISTYATRSWAEFGGTICDINSSLMGRNVKLEPWIVTANMHHTPGRRKVLLEWKRPEDPFQVLLQTQKEHEVGFKGLPFIDTLASFDISDIPEVFSARADAQVWEDIALNPKRYSRFFQLVGWSSGEQTAVLKKSLL